MGSSGSGWEGLGLRKIWIHPSSLSSKGCCRLERTGFGVLVFLLWSYFISFHIGGVFVHWRLINRRSTAYLVLLLFVDRPILILQEKRSIGLLIRYLDSVLFSKSANLFFFITVFGHLNFLIVECCSNQMFEFIFGEAIFNFVLLFFKFDRPFLLFWKFFLDFLGTQCCFALSSFILEPCRFFLCFWNLADSDFVLFYLSVVVLGGSRAMQGNKPVVAQAVQESIVADTACETSRVPKTSQSVSKTLWITDTPSSSSKITEDLVNKGEENKTFASLFQDNGNPSKGISFSKVESSSKEVEIELDDVDYVVKTWGYSLVGYVAGGFPGLEAINRPLILKHIPPLFEFGPCTHTVVLVWITLLGLLVDLWNAQALDKICSKIGNPLCSDAMTGRKNRILYARVLVEVDVAKDLVSEVAIKMPYGNRRIQQVVYENMLKFCSTCKVLGHSLDGCHKNKQVKVNQKEKMADGVKDKNKGTVQANAITEEQEGATKQSTMATDGSTPVAGVHNRRLLERGPLMGSRLLMQSKQGC
ncbi:hypothetical protein M9H77_30474 [Catharanthus roseus]|uniref:Uncharacterized protein n=1 Tax=Catharanthus roseus TaxID=4058 RepID=A0ACB9ZYN5_CATRO|nr:hypothetical protein M9H77_30474 [Catharanthus roseus]